MSFGLSIQAPQGGILNGRCGKIERRQAQEHPISRDLLHSTAYIVPADRAACIPSGGWSSDGQKPLSSLQTSRQQSMADLTAMSRDGALVKLKRLFEA